MDKKTPPRRVKIHLSPKRQELKEMEEGLKVIYGESPDDLHVVEKGVSPLTMWLTRAVIALTVLALGVLATIFIMSRGYLSGNTADPLIMSIVAPDEVKSGEEVTIEIPYKNAGDATLNTLEIDVNLPTGFTLISSSPEPTDLKKMTYAIGTLGGQSDGEIKLTGTWFANVPSTTNVQAIATYEPSNFNADFSDIATKSIGTSESVLGETFEGPSSAVPGQMLTYTATITNTGLSAIDDSLLALTLPTGFILASSTPALPKDSTSSTWPLGSLLPGVSTSIVFVGSFTSDVTDVQQIIADVKLKGNEGTADMEQVSATASTDVKGGNLRLTLVGNGVPGSVAIDPGGTLNLSFRLQNAGEDPMTDASVLIDFEPGTGVPIDWSKAGLDGGTLTKDGVQFSTKVIGVVAGGEEKLFNLSFPLKSTLSTTDVDTFTVVAHASTAATSLLSTPVTVSLNAAAAFSVSARYFDENGKALGTGPFPPVVGQATTYQIAWNLSHSIHALQNVVVTATLPPGVEFANVTTANAGALSYDAATRTVKWGMSELVADFPEATATFFVSATPGAADDGTYMKLLSASNFKATDEKTNAHLEHSLDAVTTALPDDKTADGKGLVSR